MQRAVLSLWLAGAVAAGCGRQPAPVAEVPAPAPRPADPAPGPPEFELFGRLEGVARRPDGVVSARLRVAAPPAPAAESSNNAYHREHVPVVLVFVRPGTPVRGPAGAAELRDGQLVRASADQPPVPTWPPGMWPVAVEVLPGG